MDDLKTTLRELDKNVVSLIKEIQRLDEHLLRENGDLNDLTTELRELCQEIQERVPEHVHEVEPQA